jgi:hypothetical protein
MFSASCSAPAVLPKEQIITVPRQNRLCYFQQQADIGPVLPLPAPIVLEKVKQVIGHQYWPVFFLEIVVPNTTYFGQKYWPSIGQRGEGAAA